MSCSYQKRKRQPPIGPDQLRRALHAFLYLKVWILSV
jgi:hypothetical protein